MSEVHVLWLLGNKTSVSTCLSTCRNRIYLPDSPSGLQTWRPRTPHPRTSQVKVTGYLISCTCVSLPFLVRTLYIPMLMTMCYSKSCLFTNQSYCYLWVSLEFNFVLVHGYLLPGLPLIYLFAAVFDPFLPHYEFGLCIRLCLLELCNKTLPAFTFALHLVLWQQAPPPPL